MTIETEPEFKVGGKGEFVLSSPMVYHWRKKRVRVNIPEGFETNFASVPPVLRPIISVNGRHRLPAVLHDYLYDQAGEFKNARGEWITYTRKDADKVFAEAMKKAKVSRWKRWTMYRGVRLFGGWHLKKSGIEWKN